MIEQVAELLNEHVELVAALLLVLVAEAASIIHHVRRVVRRVHVGEAAARVGHAVHGVVLHVEVVVRVVLAVVFLFVCLVVL